ncbi:TRAP transporter substrate-binding protein [Sneathiella chinensis]|uniref:C4-dicarboxylate ABC transporter substrate-binding protein n=1 Tax=Sneathiella chinensis TaxID=349750 RepID=A0ABQ5TZF1_9PROT|nr:TRAP transporter substrate-binding protein [Sneathiella chinensis]GLQ04816.1 C4-dicarboxylate ABC transporter substrate-binding protein [Sneathiella chinensis]
MKFLKSIGMVAAGAAAALIMAGNVSAEEQIKFKLHHFLGPKAPAHSQMLVPWAERIEKASNGRVKIEIYPSMSLGGKPPQLPRQVRDGIVDLAWFVNGYAAGLFPRTEVFELPGVHQGNAAATNLAMNELYKDHLAAEFKGLKPMFLHVHGGMALQMADKEVRTPADLEGLKMRIPSRTGGWVLEELGANPVKTSVPDLPLALSKKVVDGALIPFEIIPALKIQEQTQYQIEGPNGKRLGTLTFQVAMNQAKWDSLPADIQQIFTDNSGPEWLKEVGQVWDNAEKGGLAVAVKAGNKHVQLTEAEWAALEQKASPAVDRWAEEISSKGVDGKALYDLAVATVSKYMK